ncbi:MAG: hypothetical protein M0Z58_10600 [Nitrospiraceae bacterium]|nr:hypothetical protein [Nitrospiraceae bacterium]
MKKLESLSASQEKVLARCADYWVGQALLAGDSLDAAGAAGTIHYWYKTSGLPEPLVLVADSPLGCQQALGAYRRHPDGPSGPSDFAGHTPARTIMRNMAVVWSDADRAVLERVDWDLRYRVEHEICLRVGAPVKLQVWSRVCRQIKTLAGSGFEDFSSWGLAWLADWHCYYDFWQRIGMVGHPLLRLAMEQIKSGVFMSVLLDGLAVLARRPAEIHRNGTGELHNNAGPAIRWRDGCEFYFLNGIPVDEQIITTAGSKLDSALLLKTRSPEERRELVRKIGIERVCRELHAKTIDRWNGYELLELPLPDMATRAKYLKMRNPSLGVYHLEGVPPGIKTCREALSWRIGGRKWNPAELT